ncbi:MAG: PepSY-like domain-containing protein [Bacteroidales bacterium]|nr:PepSY-like domain-containing protein [Bacteroidales bacterium]
MKRFLVIIAMTMASLSIMKADDRLVTFTQLPAAAQAFINTNYPSDKISYATVDDDFIRPDFNVVLVSGVRIKFENNGALEKIESPAGVPDILIPVQIRDYVKIHYPDSIIREYEIGRRHYEIKLSNRLELKFNRNFNVIEIDD